MKTMPGKIKQIAIGTKFGRWTVLGFSHTATKGAFWRCRCDCGVKRLVAARGLRSGTSLSCGCRHKDLMRAAKTTHGGFGTPEYSAWSHMLSRCYTEDNEQFVNYGARGITVCQRWRESFSHFLADMGERPSSDLSLDRINNNGNYGRGNCRWATTKEQQRNRRNNHLITIKGITHCLTEWADVSGVDYRIIAARLARGISQEIAVFTLGRLKNIPRPKGAAIEGFMQ